jgi:hypothetical protein
LFTQRVISCFGDEALPSRSPILTAVHFSFSGDIYEILVKQYIGDPGARIQEEIAHISEETLREVMQSSSFHLR